MSPKHFPYERDARWSMLFFTLGLSDDDGVTVTDETFRASFGRWSVETPMSNIVGASVTGPHRWWTAVGLRLSLADDGLTFGTNHLRGVCVEFAEPIPRVMGLRDHSTLWVSVAEPDELVEALER